MIIKAGLCNWSVSEVLASAFARFAQQVWREVAFDEAELQRMLYSGLSFWLWVIIQKHSQRLNVYGGGRIHND
jgi:hypothetical protein